MTVSPNIKYIFLFLSFIYTQSVFSHEGKNHEKSFSYSFMAIGVENITYKERSEKIPITTSVDVSNPVLSSGGLYTFNDNWDFTIIATSTMSSDISTENWSVNNNTAGSQFKTDFGLQSNTLQSNDFTFATASTNVSIHYKFNQSWRLILDGGFSYNTFKRSNFNSLSENYVNSTVVEESVSDFSMNTGIGYEKGNVAKGETQFSFKALAGIPLWNETTNTQYQGVKFKNQKGYDLELSTSVYYPIYSGLSAGIFANYHIKERDGISVNKNNVSLELPKNKLQALRLGAGFKWNFE